MWPQKYNIVARGYIVANERSISDENGRMWSEVKRDQDPLPTYLPYLGITAWLGSLRMEANCQPTAW